DVYKRQLAPWPIEAAESVDKRRQMLGLEPLAQSLRRAQEQLAQNPCPSPPLAEWQKKMEEWAQEVGWRHASAAAASDGVLARSANASSAE
ncbi:MAG: hypothetical protein N3A66_10945, partial [Planctomycetota bacterium]|nr:hypothetical protein [Planctomycetota bacterium]